MRSVTAEVTTFERQGQCPQSAQRSQPHLVAESQHSIPYQTLDAAALRPNSFTRDPDKRASFVEYQATSPKLIGLDERSRSPAASDPSALGGVSPHVRIFERVADLVFSHESALDLGPGASAITLLVDR